MTRGAAVLAVVVLLAGCATLSEEECLTADWQAIGLADGAAGRDADHVFRHAEACAGVGITPDRAAWSAGHAAGLLRYCTPENAWNRGRRGLSFAAVCPEDRQAALHRIWAEGRAIHDVERRISALESELGQLERRLARLAREADDATAARRLAQTRAEIALVRNRIALLELELLALPRRRF